MFWFQFTHWYSLYPDRSKKRVLATVYTPASHAEYLSNRTWAVVIHKAFEPNVETRLDAALTLDEVKHIVQTLVGSQA